ncbi:MAG: hypothetical protein HY895_01875 [Deltaproteobacteria bacterium]|nr:hypothetical protein [Deltaproteobacteria bacterium]
MNPVSLRNLPYPYRAALSISSDIDCTDTIEKHHAIQTFMRETIGIDFSNTFFPYHEGDHFCLFSSRKADKDAIVAQIRSGQIDALHSFGEKSNFTRADAVRALDELERYGCRVRIWIDHADASSNLCKFRSCGRGDDRDRPEYHSDLLKRYGIRFIWTERLTNIVGQGVPLRLESLLCIYDPRHAKDSFLQMTKTILKVALSRLGSTKYAHFRTNTVVGPVTLKDGQRFFEFIRFNNHFKGAAVGDTFEDLHYLLAEPVLYRLKQVGGCSIVYTHLGKKFNPTSPGGEKTLQALRRLRLESDNGQIWVPPTGAMLEHCLATRHLTWRGWVNGGQCKINIQSIEDPLAGPTAQEELVLKGITFYTPPGLPAEVTLHGRIPLRIRHNPPDHTGKESVTIV